MLAATLLALSCVPSSARVDNRALGLTLEETVVKAKKRLNIPATLGKGIHETHRMRAGTNAHFSKNNTNSHFKEFNVKRGDEVSIVRFCNYGPAITNYRQAWVRKLCQNLYVGVRVTTTQDGEDHKGVITGGESDRWEVQWTTQSQTQTPEDRTYNNSELTGSVADTWLVFKMDTCDLHVSEAKRAELRSLAGFGTLNRWTWFWKTVVRGKLKKDDFPTEIVQRDVNEENTILVTPIWTNTHGTITQAFIYDPESGKYGLRWNKQVRYINMPIDTRVKILCFPTTFAGLKTHYDFVWVKAHGVVFKMKTIHVEVATQKNKDDMLEDHVSGANTQKMGYNNQGQGCYGFRVKAELN